MLMIITNGHSCRACASCSKFSFFIYNFRKNYFYLNTCFCRVALRLVIDRMLQCPTKTLKHPILINMNWSRLNKYQNQIPKWIMYAANNRVSLITSLGSCICTEIWQLQNPGVNLENRYHGMSIRITLPIWKPYFGTLKRVWNAYPMHIHIL